MLTPGELTYGVDFSNHQGPMAQSDIQGYYDWGARFAIVRLSFESDGHMALSAQQVQACHDFGLPVMGYQWCYWNNDPTIEAAKVGQFCRRYNVPVVALDMEDTPPQVVQPPAWAHLWRLAIDRIGFIPMMYTYPYWWRDKGINFAGLGDVRWWIAQYNERPDLDVTHPYINARVVGHQYGNTRFIGVKQACPDVFVFDAEMCERLNATIGGDMDESTVRRIVREEINAITERMGQGADFERYQRALLRRIHAAGAALDLDRPSPGETPPGG